MDFCELVKKRESVRNYDDKPVERNIIESCIEAARVAPSACNSQPWTFVVIDDSKLVKKAAGHTFDMIGKFNKFTLNAPVIIAIVIEKTNIKSKIGSKLTYREFNMMDIGIAAEHFCLQAAEHGIGTCILGYFHENKVKELIGVPKNKRIGLLISMGYPKNDNIRTKIRKEKEKMSCYNKYDI